MTRTTRPVSSRTKTVNCLLKKLDAIDRKRRALLRQKRWLVRRMLARVRNAPVTSVADFRLLPALERETEAIIARQLAAEESASLVGSKANRSSGFAIVK